MVNLTCPIAKTPENQHRPAGWALQRKRVLDRSLGDTDRVARLMDRGTFLSPQVLMFDGRTVAVRPAVALMLRAIWQHRGKPFDAYTWFLETYGRAGTVRAVRQTAFRCSRALERVGCPIVVHCRGLQIDPRPLVRRFERATAS